MKPSLLLDTHALIWFLTGHPRLSARARTAIEDSGTAVAASAASGYEIAYKARQGKLTALVVGELPAMLRKARIPVHPLLLEHTLAAGRLPGPHRDPWDRLIMAQALGDGLTVVTVDPVFAGYGVPVLW